MAKPTKPPSPITIKGTTGNDSLTLPAGTNITNVKIDGSTGNDTLNLSNYGSGVTIQLQDGFAKASSIVTDSAFTGLFPNATMIDSSTVRSSVVSVENLIGTAYNDFLFANTTSPKYVDGGAGNDIVECRLGDATLVGGSGNDWLVSYGSNVTEVGGTYVNGVAIPDGMTDYFYIGSAPTILDFEVGIDKLIFEQNAAPGTWVPNGDGSSYIINGSVRVTLANVSVSAAQAIEVGFSAENANGVVQGSSGDDLLWVGGQTVPTRAIVGANTGDDVLVNFTLALDTLVFQDGVVPTWSNTYVNGAAALLGTWSTGSVTLQGFSTSDVPNIHIEGVTSSPVYGTAAPGPWSTASDSLFF